MEHVRAFRIRSEWDDGFRLSVTGDPLRNFGSFRGAASAAGLDVADDTAFDRAYASEIDTALSFDGARYVAELPDRSATSPPLDSFAAAVGWLDVAIREQIPHSFYVTGMTYQLSPGKDGG